MHSLEHTDRDMMDKKLFDHDPCTDKPLCNYNQMADRTTIGVSIAMNLRNLNVWLQVMLVCGGDLDGVKLKKVHSFCVR